MTGRNSRRRTGNRGAVSGQNGFGRGDHGGMIRKITRGSDPAGLLRYLFGNGRHNEHEDQHVIALSGDMTDAFGFDGRPLTSFKRIGELFDRRYRKRARLGQPCPPDRRSVKRNPLQTGGLDRVWHCSLSIPANDGVLPDLEWEDIVTDFLERMGITDLEGEGATWVAVRHGRSRNGNDHVHIMVQLARDDGWYDPYNDRKKAGVACRGLEHEYPYLTPVDAIADRERVRYTYRQWREWAEWKTRTDPGIGRRWDTFDADTRTRLTCGVMADTMPRIAIGRLVRACAAASESEDEFIRRVRREGLNIDPRLRKGVGRESFHDTSQVVGYTVTWRSADGWTERVNATELGVGMRLRELRQSWHATSHDSTLAVMEWKAAMENRRPVMHDGRERHLDALTTHDMSTLINQVFQTMQAMDATDTEQDRQTARESIRQFERLLDRYGINSQDEQLMTLEQLTMWNTMQSGLTM